MVETVKFGLWMVKVFNDFTTDDKIIGSAQGLGIWDKKGIIGGHEVIFFSEKFGNNRAGSGTIV